MLSYGQREHAYRKRLAFIIPVAAALVAALFITSDVVEVDEMEKRFGWEGETRLLPEITILPDKSDSEQLEAESSLKAMASYDIDPVDEIAEAEGGEAEPIEKQKPDETQNPDLDFSDLRRYPSHTEVPYSEDYVILHMVKPQYPPRELLSGIEGDVVVELFVNEEGHVESAWVVVTNGPKSFETASLVAVKQFVFKPPMENGEPQPMWVRFKVRFRLT